MQLRSIRAIHLAVCLAVALAISGQVLAQNKANAEADALRAGAAISNITPPLDEPIVGGFSPKPATHIHDELNVRCLVLDNGQTRIGFVVSDNVGIPREVYDAARQEIEKVTGIPGNHLLMSATHTHSAISARSAGNRLIKATELSEYQQFVARRIVEGVRRAVHNLEPAKVAWGTVDEPSEVFNRRWHMSTAADLANPFGGTDQVRMNPPRQGKGLLRPAGPTDPQITFLSVQSIDGRPISLLANYSLHYVGGVGTDEISADYFALFADRIQQLLGADRLDPPFVGILSNGTSGDVNNNNYAAPAQRYKSYEKMRLVADKVAQAVYRSHQDLKFQKSVPLGAVAEDLVLKARKPTAELLERARNILAKDPAAPQEHRLERNYAQNTIRQHEGPDEVSVMLQALRIGDLGIAAIPFEVFVESGLDVKQRTPFEHSFTISLANGSYGYLPTPRHHALGGYETWLGTNLVEFEAAPKIVDVLMKLQERLHGAAGGQ
jgi:hypothetical protein